MPNTQRFDNSVLENNIKLLLTKRGITQARLASDLNMSQSMFNKHLKGHPCFTIEEIYNIAQYFHISIDSLCNNQFSVSLSDSDEQTNETSNNEIYKSICIYLAYIFKNASIVSGTIKVQETVFEEDIDIDHYNPYHRIRSYSPDGKYLGDPTNEYPSIAFSNYFPFPKDFATEKLYEEYVSDLENFGNKNTMNVQINRFLKKLSNLHTAYLEQSMTKEDYFRSIDNNLSIALSDSI